MKDSNTIKLCLLVAFLHPFINVADYYRVGGDVDGGGGDYYRVGVHS